MDLFPTREEFASAVVESFAVYPRITQAQFNARIPTWLNKKGYTALLKSMTKHNYYLCCISRERSGKFQCHDSFLHG